MHYRKISKENYDALNGPASELTPQRFTQVQFMIESANSAGEYPTYNPVTDGPGRVVSALASPLSPAKTGKSISAHQGTGWSITVTLQFLGTESERAKDSYRLYRYLRYICFQTDSVSLPFHVSVKWMNHLSVDSCRESDPHSVGVPHNICNMLESETPTFSGDVAEVTFWIPFQSPERSLGTNNAAAKSYSRSSPRAKRPGSYEMRIKGTHNRDLNLRHESYASDPGTRWYYTEDSISRVSELMRGMNSADSSRLGQLLQEMEISLERLSSENYTASMAFARELSPILKKITRIGSYGYTGNFIAGF